MTRRCVVVFGRQPIPGSGKSRLAATLGDETAAEVSRLLLAHTLRAAVDGPWRAELYLADPVAGGWTPIPPIPLRDQSRGSLGERMAAAFRSQFQRRFQQVVLIGSDCPALKSSLLAAAFRRLDERPVVLGPAMDGGYWLMGQSTPGFDLFSDIEWSSPHTLRATRDRLAQLRLRWHELETLADVDTEGDLHRFVSSATAGGSEAQLVRDLRRAMRPFPSSSASS